MDAKKVFEILGDLVEEHGAELMGMLLDVLDSFRKTEYLTHCGICSTECPVYLIEVDGKKVWRGNCPDHGFKR